MSVDEKIKKVLNPRNIQLPQRPFVEDIEPELYEDSGGEESLQVWVILSDSTQDEDLSGEHVMQIKSAVRERLLNEGYHLFPYIRLVKRAEYEPEEDPE